MRKLRENNNKSSKHHTRKEYGLTVNLGDEIDEKFHKFTILFRKNKKNKYEESKNKNKSFSSDEDNNEYYDKFLQKLTEKKNTENNNNNIKENNLKKKKKTTQKSSILSNKKYRNILKQSLMKKNPIKNNHLSLTPINEEKIDHENLLFINSLKPHPFTRNKYYSHKLNNSIDIHNSIFQSSVNSNKSKENINDKNSYILNDIKNNQSLVLGNLRVRNSKNTFTPIYNSHNKSNFSSIKTKKSPYKGYDSSFVLGIKNSKTDNLKKNLPLKEEEKIVNNSLEEASGINFKPNYNFNPKKIDIQNITLSNNIVNKENKNEKINENELNKNENNQTQNESSMRIKLKKRCLFCCLPVY